jgi:hypothetical protein
MKQPNEACTSDATNELRGDKAESGIGAIEFDDSVRLKLMRVTFDALLRRSK